MTRDDSGPPNPSRRRAVIAAAAATGSGLILAGCDRRGPDRVEKVAEFVNVVDYGADPQGKKDASGAILNALQAGHERGLRVVAVGRFRITETVVITTPADFSQATFAYGGTGCAVQVGRDAAATQRVDVSLPRVVSTRKGKTGWGEVLGSTGVRIVNLYSCVLSVPHVQGFDTGLLVQGAQGNGVSYCDVTVGHLDNNRVNQRLTALPGGWCNQNTFTGGRWSHNSNEGSNVRDTRHIRIDQAAPNNNVWVNPSLESPSVVEFAIDLDSGSYNLWLSPRLEDDRGSAPIRWGAGAERNWIVGGFHADDIKEVWAAGASTNSVLGAAHHRFSMNSAQGMVLENGAAEGAALTVMRADYGRLGDSPATSYALRLSPAGLEAKVPTDTSNRFRVDLTSGQLLLGNGTAAPIAGLVGQGDSLLVGRSTRMLGAEVDNGLDIGGKGSGRPRFVRAATATVTGAFARTRRPDASEAGVGASIFDTTLGKPLWSDGSRWVDANGTAV